MVTANEATEQDRLRLGGPTLAVDLARLSRQSAVKVVRIVGIFELAQSPRPCWDARTACR